MATGPKWKPFALVQGVIPRASRARAEASACPSDLSSPRHRATMLRLPRRARYRRPTPRQDISVAAILNRWPVPRRMPDRGFVKIHVGRLQRWSRPWLQWRIGLALNLHRHSQTLR